MLLTTEVAISKWSHFQNSQQECIFFITTINVIMIISRVGAMTELWEYLIPHFLYLPEYLHAYTSNLEEVLQTQEYWQ